MVSLKTGLSDYHVPQQIGQYKSLQDGAPQL